MTTVLLRKGLASKLEPVDDAGREALARLPLGTIVRAEIKRPRNLGHHRKFFALLDLIYQNQTRYRSPEALLDAIKIYIGHAQVLNIRGKEVHVPKSISFSSMGQGEFDRFWDRVVNVVVAEIIPGLDRSDLERELGELVA